MALPVYVWQMFNEGQSNHDDAQQQEDLGDRLGDAETGSIHSQGDPNIRRERSRRPSVLSHLSNRPRRTESPQPLHPNDQREGRLGTDDARQLPREDTYGDDVVADEDEDDEDEDDAEPEEVAQVAFQPTGGAYRRRARLHMPRIDTMSSMGSWLPTPDPGMFARAFRKVRDFIFQKEPEPMSGSQFIPNYRYLPIVSGVFSPFAILLEIPGLTEHWYIRTEGNKTVEFQENPALLDVAMAVSMGCAVIANAALIARFLEHKVKLMTYICMAFLIFHDLINIVTLTIFGIIHRFDDGFTYGEAFWLCLCSTCFSLVVTGTLLYDLLTTHEFDKSGSGLTRKQRSLVIIVMILISYSALGSLVFAEIMDVTFQDGLYFTVVSIETIGFGDIFPDNTASTIFCIIYTTIGIINVGLVVNTTRETIMEAFENIYRRRAAEIAHRRHENKMMKQERRARRILIEQELHQAGLPIYVRAEVPYRAGGGRGGAASHQAQPKLVLNEKGLEEWKKAKAADKEKERNHERSDPAAVHEIGEEYLSSDGMKGRTLELAKEMRVDLAMTTSHETEPRGETYAEFRRKVAKEELREFYLKLSVAWTLFLTFWIIGAGIFMRTEGWGFGRSLYFCWMSFSTIGYGEITPKTPAGRAIFVAWALMGVAAMTILIAVLSEAYSSRYKSALRKGALRSAIKHFEGTQTERSRTTQASTVVAEPVPDEGLIVDKGSSPVELARNILETTRSLLDPVPLNVVKHARTFHDYMKYFGNNPQYSSKPPPSGLAELLDEIVETEMLDERLKKEMLGDDDSRKALFFMSYERAFKKMVETAERAVEVIALKDAELQQLIAILEEDEAHRGSTIPGRGVSAVPLTLSSVSDGKKVARFTSDDPTTIQQESDARRTSVDEEP